MTTPADPQRTAQPGTPTGPTLPGYELVHAGKVRELYAPGPDAPLPGGFAADEVLLMVASDRISAYDHVLSTPIEDKGEVLTRMSLWWFDQLADLVPHHVLATEAPLVPEQVAGRAVLVKRLRMLPVECVARAHLTGGGLSEYRRAGTVSGVRLREGLVDGDELPDPIFTPSTKAPAGEHDEPISYEQVVTTIGEPLARAARNLTVAILRRGHEVAAGRGIIVADTKVEFGLEGVEAERDLRTVTQKELDAGSVRIVLADEVLTPDSSRFWPAEGFEAGRQQPSFDKQYVRDWLTSPASGWDKESDTPPPVLPADVAAATRGKYVEAYERLTGESFR
ncbi:phosphoribosylaminoimidazolesuccinocarboxamide synthase [Kytococcus sedentarius]|uniref:Phosphoribosylaminoimidazole-succinocarboxamide synthase n=1 Tax=Kytococcus sedentarius (strain ATCC 14392 / DSM 20547 / JCM 11482 / CCUG 33030 / NBRC 15357 / NCTC 11040 / CCM 314 / 541) TaxID=478801 RepID=C7NLA9_KYTSD|nr:phosphoribosylaminoimidazolesuccinocarboxamide synthase [Kytococcus sedentarius]ACV05651.1 phosphoribosylaminoimidazole-succinocarboxamide synthase [Kytococcus sedentarius DSM 20547]QQB64075.1 phosphoribosylaminoimidazolesuccinocarboxamide synthase [Kytococcus sedentarius]STX12933.1 Phosphoribosylaminoimidazole-succinocarboxamide synthase [Kytococcus sedentarius]